MRYFAGIEMNITPEQLIAVFGMMTGILGLIDAGIQRYSRRIKSSYAAERDFAHIRRNQEQFSQALGAMQEEVEQLLIKVAELRMQLAMLIGEKRDGK